MFSDQGQADMLFGATGALEALAELEQNTSEAILSRRASQRVKIQTKATVRPGNSSERSRWHMEGLTRDISDGGCQILLDAPILPGDVYWLSFAETHVTLGSLMARCLRCRMVREDAFEVGFRFFNDIDLAGSINHRDLNSL